MLPLHSCALTMLLCFVNCPVFTPRASSSLAIRYTLTDSWYSSVAHTGTLSRCLLFLLLHRCTLTVFFFSRRRQSNRLRLLHRYALTVSSSSCLVIRYTLTDPSLLLWQSGTLSRILIPVDPIRSHGCFFALVNEVLTHSLTRSTLLRLFLLQSARSRSIGMQPIPS